MRKIPILLNAEARLNTLVGYVTKDKNRLNIEFICSLEEQTLLNGIMLRPITRNNETIALALEPLPFTPTKT